MFAHWELCCVLLNKWTCGFSAFLLPWVFMFALFLFFPKSIWSPEAQQGKWKTFLKGLSLTVGILASNERIPSWSQASFVLFVKYIICVHGLGRISKTREKTTKKTAQTKNNNGRSNYPLWLFLSKESLSPSDKWPFFQCIQFPGHCSRKKPFLYSLKFPALLASGFFVFFFNPQRQK